MTMYGAHKAPGHLWAMFASFGVEMCARMGW